jgi:hypothetical protein
LLISIVDGARTAFPVVVRAATFNCGRLSHHEFGQDFAAPQCVMIASATHEGEVMKLSRFAAVCVAVSASSMVRAEEIKLPPEVTPALRAACEGDVRRIGCLGPSPTYAKVKSCVMSKYAQLGSRCKVQLAAVGYQGPANVPKSVKASGNGGLFGGLFKEASAR